jgi:hypothetical protein
MLFKMNQSKQIVNVFLFYYMTDIASKSITGIMIECLDL